MLDVKSTKWFKALAAVVLAAAIGLGVAAMPHTAFAADSEATITVNVKIGNTIIASDDVTYSELATGTNPVIQTNNQGYLYCKGDVWNVVGTNNYVTISDLFAKAGFSGIWAIAPNTSYLAFTCSDGVYTKYYPTKAEIINDDQYFYGATKASETDVTGKTKVKAVIAYNTNNAEISATDLNLDTAAKVLPTVLDEGTTSPRFLIGLDDSTYNSSDAMGRRYPSNVEQITIVL